MYVCCLCELDSVPQIKIKEKSDQQIKGCWVSALFTLGRKIDALECQRVGQIDDGVARFQTYIAPW